MEQVSDQSRAGGNGRSEPSGFLSENENSQGEALTPEQAKEAAKQAMEAEIARVWEKVRVAQEELASFSAQIEDLSAKIAADEGVSPKTTKTRVAALKEYQQYHKEAAARLAKFEPVLTMLEAQHQTVFGAPFIH